MIGVREFHELIKKGDLEAVQRAVNDDPQLPSLLNDSGQTAYLLAKYYRQEAIASYLLQVRSNLDLFESCAGGQLPLVEDFVRHNPELLSSRSSDGWTPLHLAAFFGHESLAQYLLGVGAPVDARSTNAMKNTPLHAAAAGSKTELARVLLAHSANVNATQEGGWTALHAAAQSGNRDLVELLVTSGADLQARASNNQAPLDLALLAGHSEIVDLLEQIGGTTN